MKAALPKVATKDFGVDRKKDGMGSLSADTRRVSTENASVPVFCETPKDKSRLLAVPPVKPGMSCDEDPSFFC